MGRLEKRTLENLFKIIEMYAKNSYSENSDNSDNSLDFATIAVNYINLVSKSFVSIHLIYY